MTRRVDKGIPIPERYTVSEDSRLIGAMQIGDSILFHDKTPAAVRALAARHAPKKYTIRRVPEGTRIWRVA